MARLSVAEELTVAVEMAARDAEATAPSRVVAETLYDSIPELIAHFSREWIIEKLAGLVRARRLKVRGETDLQLSLGFSVPRRIVLQSGERIPFADATLRKLRMYRAQIWKEHRGDKHRAVANLDKAIDLMRKYARKQPGITYAAVREREAAKARKALT